jgi:hypothetical protein
MDVNIPSSFTGRQIDEDLATSFSGRQIDEDIPIPQQPSR